MLVYTSSVITQGVLRTTYILSVIIFTFFHCSLIKSYPNFFQRKWKNDAHMAVRDCHRARKIDSSSSRALSCMAEALSQVNAALVPSIG